MQLHKRCLDDLVVVDANLEDYEPLIAELLPHERRVTLYSTGEEALRAAAAGPSTLWVINFRLSDMSGVCLLKLIRRRLRRSSIFLIGDVYLPDDERAARSVGATAYFCKPPSAAWLLAHQPRCRSPAIRAGPALDDEHHSY